MPGMDLAWPHRAGDCEPVCALWRGMPGASTAGRQSEEDGGTAGETKVHHRKRAQVAEVRAMQGSVLRGGEEESHLRRFQNRVLPVLWCRRLFRTAVDTRAAPSA